MVVENCLTELVSLDLNILINHKETFQLSEKEKKSIYQISQICENVFF